MSPLILALKKLALKDRALAVELMICLFDETPVVYRVFRRTLGVGRPRVDRVITELGLEILNGKLVDVQGWVTGEEAKTTPSPKPKTAKPRTSPRKIPADVVERRFEQYKALYKPLGQSDYFKNWTKNGEAKVRKHLANPSLTACKEWDRFIEITRGYMKTVNPKYQKQPYYWISKNGVESWLEFAEQKNQGSHDFVGQAEPCPHCGITPCIGLRCPKHDSQKGENDE